MPEVFNPVEFSVEEARFLASHLGDAPEIVEIDLVEKGTPIGVNPNAIMPAIERIYKLVQMEEKRGFQWAGVEAVKAACSTYADVFEAWRRDNKRGAPKHPSLYEWDERGRGFKGAVGADALTGVSTYFDDDGVRKPFAIELVASGFETWRPGWTKSAEPRPILKVIDDLDKGILTCPICHWTQNFDKETRSSYNMARGRMAKHLKAARKQADQHRECYTQTFGQGADA